MIEGHVPRTIRRRCRSWNGTTRSITSRAGCRSITPRNSAEVAPVTARTEFPLGVKGSFCHGGGCGYSETRCLEDVVRRNPRVRARAALQERRGRQTLPSPAALHERGALPLHGCVERGEARGRAPCGLQKKERNYRHQELPCPSAKVAITASRTCWASQETTLR